MVQVIAKKVLIAHGVNLDLLGQREPEIYGTANLASIEDQLRQASPGLAQVVGIAEPELSFFQSNQEGLFLEKLSQKWDGALINAGAWSHTSLALADRLLGLKLVYVEIHLSNLARREVVRQHSYSASAAIGVCYGFGSTSYLSGLLGLYGHFAQHPKS